ncbi:hypothetical protein FRC02_000477 [Tulasnella sp. 418]|nr:hypothetical protein FRC02_000477 [Tulasnella sp. 418]
MRGNDEQAIIRCLETEFDPTEPLMIKTDSRYSIQCVRDWLPGWIARGWKTAGGQPVKNKAVIEYLAALLDKRPGKVRLEHVYGHRGETGNEAADQLAGEGARKPPQEELR